MREGVCVQIRRKKKRDHDVGISLCSRERRREEEEGGGYDNHLSRLGVCTINNCSGGWLLGGSFTFFSRVSLLEHPVEHNSVVMSRIQIDPAADGGPTTVWWRSIFKPTSFRRPTDRPTDRVRWTQCLFCLSVCSHLFSLMCLYYSSCAQAAADSSPGLSSFAEHSKMMT